MAGIMNQKTVIIWWAIIACLFCLFPPWQYSFQRPGMKASLTNAGYHCLVIPPEAKNDDAPFGGVRIDFDRWLLQVVGISVLAGAVLFVARKKE